MECPKCHTRVSENETTCPKCHKVLQLECPNCHAIGESAVCSNCGYTILVKCSKCAKIMPVERESCTKCGFSTATSIAYQECESDELASIIIKFTALNKIKRILKSKELYAKFFFKLKNLLYALVKGVDCKFIVYDDAFVINMNKELSFATSANKAIRLALKLINSFTNLNLNVLEELGVSLGLVVTIVKKNAEELQKLTSYETNVKPLNIKKSTPKYLKGLQIVLDQYVCDEISKEYKTDSLYSLEENGKTMMFYEIILNSYILPPSTDNEEIAVSKSPQKALKVHTRDKEKDLYSFKVFDINAKCSFENCSTVNLVKKLNTINLKKNGKIITIRSSSDNSINTEDLIEFYKDNEYKVIRVSCTEEMNYKPWGVFETLFKEYFNLPFHKNLLDLSKINPKFKAFYELILGRPIKAMTPEDARFSYMEQCGEFLASLRNTVIFIEGFENLDDTTIQTLELYFDKFKNVLPNFVFIVNKQIAVHSKIKGLLRTPIYTEITLQDSSLDDCLSTLKSDATDFIQSFYFEKIKENFNGSYLYFQNALNYLKETGILIDFENKLLIRNKKSVVLPTTLSGLYKSRIKHISKNQEVSFILAYSVILGSRLDIKTLELLGIKDIDKAIEHLETANFIIYSNGILNFNNYSEIKAVVTSSLKKEAENFLIKNVIAQIGKGLDDTTLALCLGRISSYKEEYLTLWKNSQLAIKMGDYDSYLKNCLGFLSLVEYIESNISKEEIEENKKDVYNNILMFLYAYSPSKIYFIENILLMDAINEDDNDKIVKLSNLMLQGALISSNYSDALGLLHNILSRMQTPVLIVDGVVNTKFLLLSLVNIEILYNIGNFRQCIEIAEEILSILSLEVIEKVKPISFSTNLFVSHILETLRLVGFAKLFVLDSDIDEFFEKIETKLGLELPEKDCILAIKTYLSGKVYETSNIEEYSPFSKTIFLILQEISSLESDYKTFAQNIYQAKLLASDIHNKEIELLCDILIAWAYSKMNIMEKAESIYLDVLNKSEQVAMFNIMVITKYLLAKMYSTTKIEEALLLVNDALALIRKFENQSQILYALLQKLYMDIVVSQENISVDIESEEQKLSDLKQIIPLILR